MRGRTEVAGVPGCWLEAPMGTQRYPTQLGSCKHSDTALEGLREFLVLKRDQTELISYL